MLNFRHYSNISTTSGYVEDTLDELLLYVDYVQYDTAIKHQNLRIRMTLSMYQLSQIYANIYAT